MHLPLRLSVDIFMLALGAALGYMLGAKNGQVIQQALGIGAVVKPSDARSGDGSGYGGMSERDKSLSGVSMRRNDALEKTNNLCFAGGMDPADPDISPEDVEEAKRDINHDPDTVNIAVAGNANAGNMKSSLLNANRNLSNDSPDWAPTGGSEVTRHRHRYPDPAHNCVWHDLPGAGTQSVTAFGYDYSQKLFAYDKVVLVHETTLTEVSLTMPMLVSGNRQKRVFVINGLPAQSDVRLLQVCRVFKQPCIVVRTKSDMHIYNYLKERRTPKRTPEEAREDFLSDVRQDVARFKEQAEASQARFVPKFHDFVVSTAGVEAFVRMTWWMRLVSLRNWSDKNMIVTARVEKLVK
ncbi:uncharacterized protein Triagg1_8049 [Trichoderma aggressivum f. europaeum]|uniref:IRG-type G domain-containing protein n=1 Tax=Trichoderma aggressivum f. europaeum TaxID=173218 RepID=A0AAE1I8W2_9HYPO|nr:hypothetical protein Triagg1_8049 [Trichoderma aggressivum f. europaeum]